MKYEEGICEDLKNLRTEYYDISIPLDGLSKVKERMEEAKMDKKRLKMRHRYQIIGGSIAAALDRKSVV